MKTTKEWLELLNEPYRSQALKNMNPDVKNAKVINMSAALLTAFPWNHTEEGFKYWKDLFDKSFKNQ